MCSSAKMSAVLGSVKVPGLSLSCLRRVECVPRRREVLRGSCAIFGHVGFGQAVSGCSCASVSRLFSLHLSLSFRVRVLEGYTSRSASSQLTGTDVGALGSFATAISPFRGFLVLAVAPSNGVFPEVSDIVERLCALDVSSGLIRTVGSPRQSEFD